jgi:hypothetical protein
MSTTSVITKVIGPVLLLRAGSIVIDRQHFITMLGGLDREVETIAFSFFPIALLMGCIGILVLHTDRSSVAAILIRLMAWGGAIKASGLMLFPSSMAAKAVLLQRAGFLNVVLAVCLLVGGYFTWFGYFAAADSRRTEAAVAR